MSIANMIEQGLSALQANPLIVHYINLQVLLGVLVAMVVYRLLLPLIDTLNPFTILLAVWFSSIRSIGTVLKNECAQGGKIYNCIHGIQKSH